MKSEITNKGIPESLPFYGSQSYVYGLSDFWKSWFEDQELTERLLEATSYQLADIYSKFIQYCTTSSLFDIRSTFHSSIRLLLIDSDELGTEQFGNVYTLKEKVLDAKYLLDRPLASIKAYERDVHFSLALDGSTINFYKPLSEMGFASRKILKNGKEVTQYSVWATDVEIDEQALFQYFGKLVRISPETSTEVYKAYIQGLFFLYTQGPTIDLITRGVHLALGIPLARDEEEVLLIRQDPLSGDYVVVTERNSYRLPYGILPSVETGQVLAVGTELSRVAQIVDYTVADNWWIGLRLPNVLFPDQTGIVAATPNSFADYAMRNYLKHHTFLVNINLSGALTTAAAAEILRLIQDARPKYTLSINVWSVPIEVEELREEDILYYRLYAGSSSGWIDTLFYGEYLTRDHLEADIAEERSGGQWIKSNGEVGTATAVDVTHSVRDGLSGSQVNILDSHLVPLYNVTGTELKEILTDLSISFSFPTSPFHPTYNFRLSGINLVAKYNQIILKKTPLDSGGGISYNLDEFLSWGGEVNRVFVPTPAEVTASDSLVFLYSVDDLMSMYLYRPSGNIIFTPVYFPPAIEDPITISQVPI